MQGDTLAPFLFVIVLDYALRKAIDGREVVLGFMLHPRRSSRTPAKAICDLDFADDIVLLSNEIEQARELVQNVQSECRKVGLELNAAKTKAMFFNIDRDTIETIEGTEIKQGLTANGEQDFKYLGSWCDQNRDIHTRKALAWKSLHKIKRIWNSDLDTNIKVQLFRATTETILLYGCNTWTLNKKEEQGFDGTYTRMLRMMKNLSWCDHVPNGDLKKVSETIRKRRLQLAGHVYCDKTTPAHLTVTWDPRHGRAARGRPQTTYIDTLLKDTRMENIDELERCMMERSTWRHILSRCMDNS